MENSIQQMQGWHERCLGLLCDVRVRGTVKAAVDACIERFGGLDIVVNCSGYGVIAACEDQDTCDLRSQFDTNFLGTLNIIQLTLPYFRTQSAKRKEGENAGRYLIFSSTSGALGVPGLGPYCATKYATEGLIESMLYEVDAFGIKATLVEPGHVRLDEPTGLDDKTFEGMALDGQDGHKINLKRYGHFFVKKPSAAYDTPTAPAGHAKRVVQWLADRQPTSAVKSAELVWQLGHCRYPPLRLLLGSFAIESVRDRLRSIIEEIEDWKHLHFPVADEGGKRKGSKDADRDGDDEDIKDEDEDMEQGDAGGGDEVAMKEEDEED
ncbi:1,2-dihydroxy-3-keto-5-methylthiopentene dioxygenase [Vermiconidia calcicola]|uniref:1,2-dihydroxy-3-keto-5-methylthiopentene dioxygenase n=1 Tax=Vermiconidia calcicola TaxID=1690605 RepID=A0ACC3NEG6_9PEZI|nr:1,2-dihydroxy-3-keto-5-methylthiopentene dioxygenase [Vermiconidia calcicola]